MSAPISLRLCCMAAMAPALTEAASQSRITLPSSPPPNVSESPTLGLEVFGQSKPSCRIIGDGIDLVSSDPSRKSFRDFTSRPAGTKLLKQLNRHTQLLVTNEQNSTSVKNLSSIYIQGKTVPHATTIPATKLNGYPILVGKTTMNQPSSTGPNGSRKYPQTAFNGNNAVNGHSCVKLPPSQIVTHYKSLPFFSVGNIVPDQGQQMCLTTISTLTTSSQTLSISHSTTSVTSQSKPYPLGDVAPVGDCLPFSGLDEMSTPNLAEVQNMEMDTIKLTERAIKMQQNLNSRTQFLIRRLRRMQGKQLETHIKKQLGSYVEFQHKNLQTVASKVIKPPSNTLKTDLFHSEDVKNLSTAALVNLVRKLQSSQQAKLTLKLNNVPKVETKGVLVMDEAVSAESAKKSEKLCIALDHWKAMTDSDATESSSGGESSEEDDNIKIPSISLYKRAEWKWAMERASIVSRWTWLQAQVSDLEYRIRQQSEIHKMIRANKGNVVLNDAVAPEDFSKSNSQTLSNLSASVDSKNVTSDKMSPCNISTLLINVSRQASKLTQSLGNCLSPINSTTLTSDKFLSHCTPKNGVVDGTNSILSNSTHVTSLVENGLPGSSRMGPAGDLPDSLSSSPDLSQPLDITCQAARCRPLKSYRKRKLLRTAGLHQMSHKAARLSSVKCQCYPPVQACPMCGGRYNNFQQLDSDTMPLFEKVSLLDPAFHPVLSFPQEISLPIHFEALLKSGEWQAKPSPKTVRTLAAIEKRKQKLFSPLFKGSGRKARKKLTKSAAAVLLTSAKLRNKYEKKVPTPKKVSAESRLRRKELKRRRAAQLAIALKRNNRTLSQNNWGEDWSSYSQTPSPQLREGCLSSSGSQNALRDMKESSQRRKKGENAFDINNIVIPYSMAASTRVEKLQYKEIQTPKWRDITLEEEFPEIDLTSNLKETVELMDEEGEIEDASDEIYQKLHQECEIQEKKRFTSFLTNPSVRRSRNSRSESEGVGMDFTDSLTIDAPGSSKVGGKEIRRRSGSGTSRRASIFQDEGSQLEYELHYVVDPWPLRSFPLTEEEYIEMQRVLDEHRHNNTQQIFMPIPSCRPRRESIKNNAQQPSTPTCISQPASPMSCSSTSLIDDTNDPEWTTDAQDRASQKSSKS
ncbi:hypothetical protein ACJMK2_021265 [Sinanodonta woodiana]|uniref:PEHE domain-containing protein n=1 Tax=Sinanodonta woodiana TaxID=1069815 RepID=A0ABD3TFK8_SINWO